MAKPNSKSIQPLALDIGGIAAALSVSTYVAHRLLLSGEIRSKFVGRQRIAAIEDVRAFLAKLDAVPIEHHPKLKPSKSAKAKVAP